MYTFTIQKVLPRSLLKKSLFRVGYITVIDMFEISIFFSFPRLFPPPLSSKPLTNLLYTAVLIYDLYEPGANALYKKGKEICILLFRSILLSSQRFAPAILQTRATRLCSQQVLVFFLWQFFSP